MVSICETSDDLNGCSNIRKLLKIGFINNLIQFEARYVTKIINVEELLAKEYFGINNDNMDDAQKLTFENVNKINGFAANLITWLTAQLKYNQFENECKKNCHN